MTTDQIEECMALFDRVNPGLAARQVDHTPRDKFKARLSEGPGIALGAVVDYCLPEGWNYSLDTALNVISVSGRRGNSAKVTMTSQSIPALAMVRAISAAIGGEG